MKAFIKNNTTSIQFQYLFIALLSILLMDCNTTKSNGSEHGDNKEHNEGGDHDNKGPKLGETLELNNKDRVAIASESLKLKINKVADSRCPLNVQCIQAGTAKVQLSVIKEDMLSWLN